LPLLYTDVVHAGIATLFWDPPTTNTNGTPLTDIAGYTAYYGASSENYSQSINVDNVATYALSLADGATNYVAVTAYDSSGNESDYSNEVKR
jgi:hypothetical protein